MGNSVSGIIFFGILFYGLVRIFGQRLGFYLSWKFGLMIAAFLASIFIPYSPTFSNPELLANLSLPQPIYSWMNFDGVHYLIIAKKGYLGTGLIQAFFPLFPLLLRIINFIFNHFEISFFIISSVFTLALLYKWQHLLKLEGLPKWTGTLVLFLFPTALFFNALYTEAMFLFFVLSCFIEAKKGRWLTASLLTILASATRITGVFLVPALVWELMEQKYLFKNVDFPGFIKSNYKNILIIIMGASGLIAYMVYLKIVFNDPLYFFHVQEEFGAGRQETIILLPQVIWRYLKILATARPIDLKYFAYVQEFLAGVFGTIALIWAWFKVRRSYVIFSALAFILPTLTGTFSSLPRYLLGSFAIFLLMTQLLQQRRRLAIIWLVLSTFWLIFNTILFIQGYWVA